MPLRLPAFLRSGDTGRVSALHDPAESPLAAAVREIESYVASAWDRPPRLFALARADSLTQVGGELPQDVAASVAADPGHLIGIEQEDFATDGTDLEQALATIAWPETVDGAALAVERVIVPPSAEAGLPTDPAAALEALATHPERQDVRLVVGVLRSGESWCALRSRAHDAPDAVAFGTDLVPGLVRALAATFEE